MNFTNHEWLSTFLATSPVVLAASFDGFSAGFSFFGLPGVLLFTTARSGFLPSGSGFSSAGFLLESYSTWERRTAAAIPRATPGSRKYLVAALTPLPDPGV